MSKFWHILLQVLAGIGQVGNVASGIVPPKYQGLAAGILGLVQAILAYVNHK